MKNRAVTIYQDINMPENKPDEITIQFTNSAVLEREYKRFYENLDCANLKIKTDNFDEACKAFNSLFRIIKAAGGIVRNNKNEYLFIKRMDIWDLPKGKLHKNELIAAGALREVNEETGLTGLTITKQLPSTFHIYTDRKGVEVLKETFWFIMMCHELQNLIPQVEEDITEVKWFSDDSLIIPFQNTYASIRHLLENYIGQ